MSSRTPAGPDGTKDPGSSGITVIVVGLGLGGLAAAIECHRKGHLVKVFEQSQRLQTIGDSIAIASNAASIVAKWGNGTVHDRLQPLLAHVDVMNIYNSKAELLTQNDLWGYGRGNGYPAHRADLAQVFYDHATSLGIEINFGQRITEYWETESEAGIVVNGQRISADCVIGSDGVHSKARGPVTGQDARPHSSGYAMYRAWFGADDIKEDPKTSWITDLAVRTGYDQTHVFIGTDIHAMLGTSKRGMEVFWMCTHKDKYDVTESWSTPGKVEDMLEYIKDWECLAMIEAFVRKTPRDRLIDHKLLWRDPLTTWISPTGRMCLIGDAAHPFLPTSGQGASQAIEDAATIAIALELAGKDRVPLGMRAMQMMRYDRASLCQKMGVETRDAWHKVDWEKVKTDKEGLKMPRPDWLFSHDPQQYAYDEFFTAVDCVLNNKSYEPRNIPVIVKEGDHRLNDFDTNKLQPLSNKVFKEQIVV